MNPSDDTFTDEDVAAVAHQLWEDEGRPEGKAEEHWRAATEHLRRVQPQPITPPAGTPSRGESQ